MYGLVYYKIEVSLEFKESIPPSISNSNLNTLFLLLLPYIIFPI